MLLISVTLLLYLPLGLEQLWLLFFCYLGFSLPGPPPPPVGVGLTLEN